MDSKLFSKFLIKALRDLQFFLNLQNKIQLTIFTKRWVKSKCLLGVLRIESALYKNLSIILTCFYYVVCGK